MTGEEVLDGIGAELEIIVGAGILFLAAQAEIKNNSK
jgi:hypothetical protein